MVEELPEPKELAQQEVEIVEKPSRKRAAQADVVGWQMLGEQNSVEKKSRLGVWTMCDE